jgi:hypothetical protein
MWCKVIDSSLKIYGSWVIKDSTISLVSNSLCVDQIGSSMSSSTSIAHGISWVSCMLNPVVGVFIFLLTEVYTLWDFSRFFLGGSLSPSSFEPSIDVNLVSIPLVLYFVLDGVLFWEIFFELGFLSTTSLSCCQ